MRAASAAPVFAALGDDTRLAIVARLSARGPQSITELADAAPVTRQAVRKHLRALEEAGLAAGRRVGREHIWELRRTGLADAQRYLDEISAQWDAAIERLRRMVEEEA
ncbi:MAG TPA: metalloregulator ArsR/SmtB family transcription factor [Longimicrobiales bacterium]|nr:metalloregulator ArsR/SmtB family transcription factor [Longimicrobiales bacterium]